MKIIWQGVPGKVTGLTFTPDCGAERSWLENLERESGDLSNVSVGMVKEKGEHFGYAVYWTKAPVPESEFDYEIKP